MSGLLVTACICVLLLEGSGRNLTLLEAQKQQSTQSNLLAYSPVKYEPVQAHYYAHLPPVARLELVELSVPQPSSEMSSRPRAYRSNPRPLYWKARVRV